MEVLIIHFYKIVLFKNQNEKRSSFSVGEFEMEISGLKKLLITSQNRCFVTSVYQLEAAKIEFVKI